MRPPLPPTSVPSLHVSACCLLEFPRDVEAQVAGIGPAACDLSRRCAEEVGQGERERVSARPFLERKPPGGISRVVPGDSRRYLPHGEYGRPQADARAE